MEVEPRVRLGRAAIRDVQQTVRKLRFESLANCAAETSTAHQLGVESRRPGVRNRAGKILQAGGQIEKGTERLALVESGPNCERKRAYSERLAILQQDPNAPDTTTNHVRFVDPTQRRDDNEIGYRSDGKVFGAMKRMMPADA